MQENKRKRGKIFAMFFIILFIFLIAFNYSKDTFTIKQISYNNFINLLDEKQISKVVITSENILITPSENNPEYKGKTLCTLNINDGTLMSKLQESGVDVEVENTKKSN